MNFRCRGLESARISWEKRAWPNGSPSSARVPWAATPERIWRAPAEDVTFIDFWPAHVDEMKRNGLRITHHDGEEPFTVKVRALHLTEAQHLSKEAPIDIAFVCTKSYDTHWAALLIRQYLAPGGYVVSLQNCMNEATIADLVVWGKTMGCIASDNSVGLVEPGDVACGGVMGGAAHTVYRNGEVHGTIR